MEPKYSLSCEVKVPGDAPSPPTLRTKNFILMTVPFSSLINCKKRGGTLEKESTTIPSTQCLHFVLIILTSH